MKSKRGFLLGEYTLKIIIAVICLILLLYLLYSIYSGYIDDKNMKLAEATMNEFAEKMNEAKVNGESEILVLNPTEKSSFLGRVIAKEWWIIAWPYKGGNKKPNQCLGNYCTCICATGIGESDSLKQCNSLGICKDFNEKIEIVNPGLIFNWNRPIPIKNPPLGLKITYTNKEGFTIKEK